ncbi:MAG TPA: alpha/beta fold hydrolase [Candidatus Dormibacteraeota bacterium]|nr:alpha/beta fold hydrolase [Candidatus Dormibacteraeota bacterium]
MVYGGPGFTHNYLTSLEELAENRQVNFWDQLRCGRPERPTDRSLWTMERSFLEVDAGRERLQLDRHHLFGNSWGGMLVQQYVLDRRPDLVSPIASNSLSACRSWKSRQHSRSWRCPGRCMRPWTTTPGSSATSVGCNHGPRGWRSASRGSDLRST